MNVHYRTQQVSDVKVFYREAGPANAPVLLLLHGFPTSGHMFRDLIPLLADTYRVIAPDLPGFGNTEAPPRGSFAYTFDNLARVIGGFVEALGLTRYALYVFDYGAPTGFRLAVAHPERVSAIISQNGNAYVEGLSAAWEPWQAYWRNPTPENREACRDALSPAVVRDIQYGHGANRELISPDGYTLDLAYLARPDADEIQLDLILDYRSNVALYPTFQDYFRTHRPPLLAIWGRNDPFFLPPGAEAYKRDLPDADVRFLDTGHFALETHAGEIAHAIRQFLGARLRVAGDAAAPAPKPATIGGFPAVPTTKILALGRLHAPLTPEQRKAILPREVPDTVRLYLAGKIDQWWSRQDGKGPAFLLNVSTLEEARALMASLPLDRERLMEFDFIELGPLRPLQLLLQ